ncbi:uncharacterized protein YbjT (DUF2867 family) [Haloactinopolyspora alba]|uniref:Uncharacterized protein YbjT (DUF2867 family) n=1 Tax=Haloactinopolyspora alba TaxID=648780 RepID=A0A2P8E5N2_9ACTN|nr:uncharacterized protein YbjT (DUF2867 family) [Haloactinopolyspora alba]
MARALTRRGARVRGFGRRRDPAAAGTERMSGDLADPDALRAAFNGVTHVSVTLPLSADAERADEWVSRVAAAATDARVERLVFNGSNRVPAAPTDVEIFESRRRAAATLLGCGVPTVVLRPPVYLENLLMPGMYEPGTEGATLAYPLAADRRVAWLSHDDLAALTVAAFSDDALVGRAVDVGGADVITGPELAAAFASVLGSAVTYRALPVDVFERGMAAAMGPAAAGRVAQTYRWLNTPEGAGLYDGSAGGVEETFGVPLTPLRDWIAKQPWRQ